jgi:hypothetical protein
MKSFKQHLNMANTTKEILTKESSSQTMEAIQWMTREIVFHAQELEFESQSDQVNKLHKELARFYKKHIK